MRLSGTVRPVLKIKGLLSYSANLRPVPLADVPAIDWSVVKVHSVAHIGIVPVIFLST